MTQHLGMTLDARQWEKIENCSGNDQEKFPFSTIYLYKFTNASLELWH